MANGHSIWMTLGLIALVPVLVAASLLAFIIIRAAILHLRFGSFPAFLLVGEKWVRGIAEYGRSRLIWRQTFRFSMKPDVELARRRIDVEDAPSQWYQSRLVVVALRSGDETVHFALRSGDAAGLVSWIDSSPPGM